jgi:AraC-like DNA-binding protein
MHFAYHEPPGQLSAYVKTIWATRGTKEEFASPEPIVPDGCVEIIFNLADPFRNGDVQPFALLAGQMTGPVVAVPTGAVDLIGVRLRPGRAGAALRTAMWRLQDRLIDASAVLPGMDRVVDDLRNMGGKQRLDYLSSALATHFGSAGLKASGPIDHALAMIESRRGNIAIDRLATHLGITRRHLERRFREEVGLPAKQMARIARVHAVLSTLRHQPWLSGAEIAADCGYSDQPHMIRECKALAGHTPARLMTSGRSLAGLMRIAPRILQRPSIGV